MRLLKNTIAYYKILNANNKIRYTYNETDKEFYKRMREIREIAIAFGKTTKSKRSGRYAYWIDGKRINNRISPN